LESDEEALDSGSITNWLELEATNTLLELDAGFTELLELET
jgi:hypothetical protein